MLTKGFYYFLLLAELAILGLIIAGIHAKVKRIMAVFAERVDDQISEHYVSKSKHTSQTRGNISLGCPIGPSEPAGESKSEPMPMH